MREGHPGMRVWGALRPPPAALPRRWARPAIRHAAAHGSGCALRHSVASSRMCALM